MKNIRENIIILDFGSKSSLELARKIRKAKVYCEILPYTTSVEKIMQKNPKAIVLSGGPCSIFDKNAPMYGKEIFDIDVPILGIGYGMDLICHLLDGKIDKSNKKPYEVNIDVDSTSLLFKDIQNLKIKTLSKENIARLPDGFDIIAKDEDTLAFQNKDKKIYGIKFWPEDEIIENFLFEVANCSGLWSIKAFIKDEINAICQKVGNKKVICGLSGGVDSSVAALLVHKAIGDNLTCIFVDHGLLRKNEAESVINTFKDKHNINLIAVDAKKRFLDKLSGVTDPEKKRKIIGEEFIRVFEEEAAKLGKVDFLVQGTLYSDVVESGTDTSAMVKSHHNVGGLPEDLDFELIEPLRVLFKDEVRELGIELNLSEEIIHRQPFPGPGLAIRIIGEVTEEKLNILRQADNIVTQEIKKAGLYKDIWQAFAVLPDIQSVGVSQEARTYNHTIAVRAVESHDGMNAEWSKIPFELLDKISNRITGEVKGVNRVVYDITSKPPSTIEWE